MNIIIGDISHKLIKEDNEYKVYRANTLIGYIGKAGAEILYTARDTDNNILATGASIREALENMILNMFYSSTYTGERLIKTLGAWIEGKTIDVEYVKNEYVKHVKRVVRYDNAAGDFYIVIDNNKYFYCEFQ